MNLDLDQEFKKISKAVKLNFIKYNSLEDQLIDLKKSQNEIFSLQAILKNINGSLKNRNLSQITKIPIDLDLLLETLKDLIIELGCYIEGVKFNNQGELVFITKSNKSNSLQNLFENWQKMSIQCDTLMSANKRLEKVAEILIQEKILNEISTSSEKGILSLNTIKKEVGKISQEINQGFSLISTYLIKEKIQKIQIHQEKLKNIQKKLNELIEIFMKISNNPLDIKNVKTLISKFGKNCTGLIIDTNGKESFSFNIDGFHKSFDQLNEEYESLESTIETTLKQAISKINSGKSWLKIKQRLEKIFLISFLVAIGYFACNNSSTKFLIKQSMEKLLPQQQNDQIYSETVPQQPEGLTKPQELNDQLSLTNAQKLAMEAALMSQNAPHPLEQWQQIETKWLEAIKLLETIRENSILYSQVKEKLETYKSNHIAINQRIITEKTAIANLENAQKLAWEASIIVQKPPHPLEVWFKAQSKLEQAITLLKTIPKGSFVESQAQNKLETYQANYNVITQQVKNAQN
ncbi:hypothetical protein [Microcoleus sp. FACHB-672]|uniref:hypothetical protein n=1 Tax=Microcoleus sp. FACHB-672 TaxID=2692825 RepID=UPI00168417DD|nr:hypothetical protein [Microcoleus sp. FACHB-672]